MPSSMRRSARAQRAARTSGVAMLLSLLAACWIAAPATAQRADGVFALVPPSYFTARDGAFVFAEPDASSQVLDVYGPANGVIEAQIPYFADDQSYVRIIYGEGAGWMLRADLEPAEGVFIADTALPAGLQCVGAEPFWGVRVMSESRVQANWPGLLEDAEHSIIRHLTATGRRGAPVELWIEQEFGAAQLSISAGACSNSMSDITYPWTARLLFSVADDTWDYRLYEGCCRLRRDL